MASTKLQFQIRPYFGGSSTADGAVVPQVVVPTTLFLVKLDAGQVAPEVAGYSLSNVDAWLYEATATEPLVGVYYWYVEDADDQKIEDGFIDLVADDAGPYFGAKSKDEVDANRSLRKVPRGSADLQPGGDVTRSKQSANSTTLVERLS